MNSLKLNVCRGLSKNRLIGPFFFEDDNINREIYLAVLQSFFFPELRRLKKVLSAVYQQDSACVLRQQRKTISEWASS